jgi:Pregnancy-associated plasma protein-A
MRGNVSRLRARVRVAAALALALGVFTALNVSPAAAQTGSAAGAFCVTNLGLLPTFGQLGPAAGARGDSRSNEPDTGTPADAPGSGKAGKSFRVTIPVYFHVITPDGSTGNVSDTVIQNQMKALNDGFSGALGGAPTGFTFRLVSVDRTVNPTWYNASPSGQDEFKMKRALHQGGANALNIYSSTAGAYLGWSYFPSQYHAHPEIDGIVIDWESMPGTSSTYAGRYDLGYTVTHETGHWLGLYHTFQGACNAKGDHVDDTPAEATPTSGCPVGKDTCPDPGLDPIDNFMDYSYDECYTEFTAGQAQRMQDQYLAYRAGA